MVEPLVVDTHTGDIRDGANDACNGSVGGGGGGGSVAPGVRHCATYSNIFWRQIDERNGHVWWCMLLAEVREREIERERVLFLLCFHSGEWACALSSSPGSVAWVQITSFKVKRTDIQTRVIPSPTDACDLMSHGGPQEAAEVRVYRIHLVYLRDTFEYVLSVWHVMC